MVNFRKSYLDNESRRIDAAGTTAGLDAGKHRTESFALAPLPDEPLGHLEVHTRAPVVHDEQSPAHGVRPAEAALEDPRHTPVQSDSGGKAGSRNMA